MNKFGRVRVEGINCNILKIKMASFEKHTKGAKIDLH